MQTRFVNEEESNGKKEEIYMCSVATFIPKAACWILFICCFFVFCVMLWFRLNDVLSISLFVLFSGVIQHCKSMRISIHFWMLTMFFSQKITLIVN